MAIASKDAADLLTEAKGWFQSGIERDDTILQRRKAREAAVPAKEVQTQPTAPSQTNGLSPLDPRRAANAAAASAMYPTPPDAVQNPLGIFATAIADAVTSSPAAPSSVAAPVDTDTTMVNAVVMADTEGNHWEPTEPKRDRGDSTFDGDDNLFGDMGPDMFGDTDITDADFSFFDEQNEDEALDLSNYLRRHSKSHRKTSRSDNTNALLRTITGGMENSSLQASPEKVEDVSSDADDMSLESDGDDSPGFMEDPTSPFKASTKRLNFDDDIVSHATSLRDLESVIEDSDPSLAMELPRIAKVEAPEVAVTKYFDDPEPLLSQLSLQDDDIITVAQILTEQATSGTPGGTETTEPADGDAILIDITDQTWGVVLAHRLSNSTLPGELSSSLISGYLVKRGGTKVEDPPVMMEVNIVHTDGNPRALEALLREMLSYFRGLGTLARARGMVDRETDVRPWHVAAAEKGVRALYLLM
ncbi:hypothetical protein ACHAQA_003170 [Verticillium albo-atrum]